MILAASVQAAPSREADVVVTALGELVLVRRDGANEVVAVERGGPLLGVANLGALTEGDRVRYVPARRAAGVQYAAELELLPPVAAHGACQLDVGVVAAAVDAAKAGEGAPRPVVVDVRSRAAFDRGHLPGAVSAPELGQPLATVLPRDRRAQVIFYGRSRQDGRPVAALRHALRLGYANACVYAEGMRQWETGRRTVEVDPPALRASLASRSAVVLDVRAAEERSNGTLPGAIPVNEAELKPADWLGRPGMPALVIVGHDGDDPVPARVAERIRVAQPAGDALPLGGLQVLGGGFAAWRRAGGKVVPPSASATALPCAPRPGELCPDEFLAAWRGGGPARAALLLDVRASATEYRPPSAVHIPLARLSAELSKLPRDRDIVVFCGRGITSRIAQALLDDAGFKARYAGVPAPSDP